MRDPSRWDRRRLARAIVALASAVVGLLLISTSLGTPSAPEATPADSADESAARATPPGIPSPTPSARIPASTKAKAYPRRSSTRPGQRFIPDRITGPVLPESDPISVSIPRIDARSPLLRLGLDARGELEVPQDPAQAGWFILGAAPGALGPAVIAGHVTWNGAPGVFYRLGSMRPGDQVRVRRRDGRTAIFTVDRVARFPKSRFPTKAVYGAIDHAGLRLITCGGTYDASRHRYLDNVVVFASLSAVRGFQNR